MAVLLALERVKGEAQGGSGGHSVTGRPLSRACLRGGETGSLNLDCGDKRYSARHRFSQGQRSLASSPSARKQTVSVNLKGTDEAKAASCGIPLAAARHIPNALCPNALLTLLRPLWRNIRCAQPPKRNTFSNADRHRDAAMAERRPSCT